jgi:hypothetical protein
MNKKLNLSLYEIVGSSLCVASDDGQKVHDRIAVAFREGHGVILSFHNINTLTSAFLNAAIGQLYGEFTEGEIRESLEVADMQPDDQILLKRVVDTAKEYFKDPKFFDEAIREAMEEVSNDQ